MNSLPELSRRPATAADRDLFLRLYASTRARELALTGWTDAEKEAFVLQQFTAQDTYYRNTWPDAAYDAVELSGESIGRIYVDLRPGALQLMEITLLPERRGQGLGTILVREVIAQADSLNLPVSLFVEAENPAQRLYARLGFQFAEDHGIYQLLVRPAK
jgi:ribosomal protein S18 acetylase RimI-like enzyme